MARRTATFSKLTQPVRSLWQRFAYSALVLAAFALMLLGKADIIIIERARVAVTDAVVPVLEILSEPASSLMRVVDKIVEMRDLHSGFERLKQENKQLRQWRDVAAELQAENLALRRLTHFVPPKSPKVITGRVISNTGGPFVRSILVNVGSGQGVRRGMAAVTGTGFVGVVVEVGERHSRVLLMTDLNSQIPVVVQTTRDPGVVSGDNSARPRLFFLPQNARVSAGDPVVTSGAGGVLPAGLLVGVISAISDAGARVKPLVDWDRLEFVRFLDYRLDGMAKIPGTARASAAALGPLKSDSPQAARGKISKSAANARDVNASGTR
jgi:rod shape-determining protein MreC